jgi:hypothetical protein
MQKEVEIKIIVNSQYILVKTDFSLEGMAKPHLPLTRIKYL